MTDVDITEPQRLYGQYQVGWSNAAKLMFDCASRVNNTGTRRTMQVASKAHPEGCWRLPWSTRLLPRGILVHAPGARAILRPYVPFPRGPPRPLRSASCPLLPSPPRYGATPPVSLGSTVIPKMPKNLHPGTYYCLTREVRLDPHFRGLYAMGYVRT